MMNTYTLVLVDLGHTGRLSEVESATSCLFHEH